MFFRKGGLKNLDDGLAGYQAELKGQKMDEVVEPEPMADLAE